MSNPKPHTVTKTATERLIASRGVKDDAISRELAWVAIVCRAGIWPAWRSDPATPQTNFLEIVNIETPAGRLVYRLAVDELDMFAHLPKRENDGVPCGAAAKTAALLHLATEGW